jgi:hypothetical protein
MLLFAFAFVYVYKGRPCLTEKGAKGPRIGSLNPKPLCSIFRCLTPRIACAGATGLDLFKPHIGFAAVRYAGMHVGVYACEHVGL